MSKGVSRWDQEKEDELICLITDGYNFSQVARMIGMDISSVIQKFEIMHNLKRGEVDWRKNRPQNYVGSSKRGLTPEERRKKAYIDKLYPDK